MKEKFLKEIAYRKDRNGVLETLVIMIQLPDGNVETIINHTKLDKKVEYLDNTYDDKMVMKNNEKIKIVNWMVY